MKTHFIGIGGIGVSALAKIYLHKGSKVSGSDLASSEITKDLKKKGATIYLGHRAVRIKKDIGLVIYSPAVRQDNPELKAAKKLKIKTLSYPQALGQLSKEYYSIAVSGTHGKSTVCAMLALVLIKAGLDPTVVVGTKLKEFGGSNARIGKSKYFVFEADEYRASFLNYWPKIIVCLNIEKEHLDFYRDLAHILKYFQQYISHLPKDGVLVTNKDDGNCLKMKAGRIKYFSLRQKEAGKIKKVMKVPGQHNLANALAVLGAARVLGIKDSTVLKALGDFRGTWRRFEIVKQSPYVVISDYAHHPTEVRALLQAARAKYGRRRIICVYQPHQAQRTKLLFNEFAAAFDLADKVVLTENFEVAGREKKKITGSFSAAGLVKEINSREDRAVFVKNLEGVAKRLKKEIRPKDVVLIVGAGDIYKLSTEKRFKLI